MAFRSGSYFFQTADSGALFTNSAIGNPVIVGQIESLNITYVGSKCTKFKNSTTAQALIDGGTLRGSVSFTSNHPPSILTIENCTIEDVECVGIVSENPQRQCRLNLRMSATLMLTGCLLIKAIYMVVINISAQQKIKTHCLTFGDVLVASAVKSDLQVRNECLVNAGDGHRHHVNHTCHKKHCSKGSEQSLTGDDIGHCQKCTKFNVIDKAADLPHPNVSTKYKKSLISNLGTTAVSQMMILMLCSLVMLGISIMLAIFLGSEAVHFKETCNRYPDDTTCGPGLYSSLKQSFGTFGGLQGSGYLSSLPSDSLSSEMLTFVISNGAQLLYSLLYLLLIYNITLISMERDWGNFEKKRLRLRCTLVKGDGFEQSYLLQLPKKVLYPMMTFSATMHWLLGQAISTTETIWVDPAYRVDPKDPADSGKMREHSLYTVSLEALRSTFAYRSS